MKAARLLSLGIACTLLATVSVAAGATPLAGPCAPGTAYDPACDVDHDGDVDIYDIQLTAGHWGQTGTYNIYPTMVPRTGQITSYAAGDDGALQKGVAWPTPRFTDNLDGTVTDNLTGLIWLKNANCFGAQTWTTALANANSLANGSCGLTDGSVTGDWRLPNARELLSLIDYGRSNPAFPVGHPFTDLQSNYYWASTTFALSTTMGWVVNLGGGVGTGLAKTNTYYVWAVRDGQ